MGDVIYQSGAFLNGFPVVITKKNLFPPSSVAIWGLNSKGELVMWSTSGDLPKPVKVIYHAGCFDGFCAAWVMRKVYPDAEFIPAQYGDAPPDVKGCKVFIVDFSYKRNVMLHLIAETRGDITVLDHHKTAEVELKDLIIECYDDKPMIHFDMTKSGGRLAWEFCFGECTVPWLVSYTEDRDLWKHELPHSKEVNAALRSYPMDFKLWDEFSCASDTFFVSEGRAILRQEKQIVDQHVRHAGEGVFVYAIQDDMDGTKFKIVNATVLISEIAGELAKGMPFGVCYFINENGEYVYSLRSDNDGMDVSEIAKKYGGGGHKHAAGFTVSTRRHL